LRYRVHKGLLTVTAEGSDTVVRFDKMAGSIELDPEDPPAKVKGELSVDLRSFDAGDRFKNWKIESELGAEQHPTAELTLARLEGVTEESPGKFRGRGRAQIRWRGKRVDVTCRGHGLVSRRELEVRATFELSVRELGLPPASFLLFRSGDALKVDVVVVARA
jgi:hypothetical protein